MNNKKLSLNTDVLAVIAFLIGLTFVGTITFSAIALIIIEKGFIGLFSASNLWNSLDIVIVNHNGWILAILAFFMFILFGIFFED